MSNILSVAIVKTKHYSKSCIITSQYHTCYLFLHLLFDILNGAKGSDMGDMADISPKAIYCPYLAFYDTVIVHGPNLGNDTDTTTIYCAALYKTYIRQWPTTIYID